MAQCVECKVSMGYTETNVAREHKGLCVACHVKSLVKQKVSAANKPHSPTNVRSIDNLFSKFEDMLITSETASNLRIRRRFGVVHGEGVFIVSSVSFKLIFCSPAVRSPNLREAKMASAFQDSPDEAKAKFNVKS